MNIVRDRPAARWLPSRYRFALARLLAFAMLVTRSGERASGEPVILAIERDQTQLEVFGASIWFVSTTTCFVAAMLPLPVPLAILAAFPLTLVALEIPIYATGLLFNNARVNSWFLVLCGIAAAAYFATRASWARFAAYVFLGTLALNAIAFVILWLLRHQVRAAEARCVA